MKSVVISIRALSGGLCQRLDDMFSVHPDLFCTHVMNAGGIGTGKSALTKYVAAQLMNGPGLHRVLIADLKREYPQSAARLFFAKSAEEQDPQCQSVGGSRIPHSPGPYFRNGKSVDQRELSARHES